MFNDVTTQALQLALAGLNTRQRVTANNIANTETPGFTASDVTFEDSLASALQGGDASGATVSEDPTSDPAGTNGNNVDLAAQMVTASKTVLQEELARRTASVTYALVDTSGPPHQRTFTSSAIVEGVELGRGSGRSKKASEQMAAREALGRLEQLTSPRRPPPKR